MKHCVDCLEEYRDDLQGMICPECGGELHPGESPRFSAEGSHEWGRFHPLVQAASQWEADLLRGRLEVEGLHPIQSPSRYYSQHNIPPTQVTTGITVLVRREELEDAHRILREISDRSQDEAETGDDQEMEPDASDCNDCGIPETEPADPDLDNLADCDDEAEA